MKKQIILILCILITTQLLSQVHGYVKDKLNEAIPGVYVRWAGNNDGVVTNADGHFQLNPEQGNNLLVFSNVAYNSDTVDVSKSKQTNQLEITLDDAIQLKEVTVTQQRLGKIKSRTAVFNVETLNTHELRKAACCNLSESFETNASVDVSYSDAATGAKQIKLLGLSGTYVQMLTENIPNLRGLSSAYGMGYIPGPWMESIQISKGTASVKNGYEAIAGQINVEYKKPQTSDKVSLNLFTNSTGRVETNADVAVKLSEKTATSVLMHASDEFMTLDDNRDGYMDLPKVKQYNLANRWFYNSGGYILQAFVRGLSEKRTGGRTDDSYKIGVNTERYEFFVKNGFLFGDNDQHHNHSENEPVEKHNQSSLGIIFNGTIHNQDARYGLKQYDGHQSNLYANLIYDASIGTQHKISTGASFNMDVINENLNLNSLPGEFNRTEYIPGIFGEYTFTKDALTAMAGLRVDNNSVYGTFITPRFHVRYNILDHVHLRASAGKGYRSPNVLAENNYLLASNRLLNIAGDLKMENAWNYGFTVHGFFPLFGKELSLMGEWFYTDFNNQVVADMDTNPHAVSFSNLRGKSYSSSFQIEANIEPVRGLTATFAHRINDVKTTINGNLREKPLTNRSKSLASLSYQTPLRKWQFDFTTQFNGGGRLPDPDPAHPLWEREFKPFTIMNAQVTKNFKTWSVYGGAENITGFVQQNPIIDVQNPFGTDFDASMVWGPMHGRTLYVGFRWALTGKDKL